MKKNEVGKGLKLFSRETPMYKNTIKNEIFDSALIQKVEEMTIDQKCELLDFIISPSAAIYFDDKNIKISIPGREQWEIRFLNVNINLTIQNALDEYKINAELQEEKEY